MKMKIQAFYISCPFDINCYKMSLGNIINKHAFFLYHDLTAHGPAGEHAFHSFLVNIKLELNEL